MQRSKILEIIIVIDVKLDYIYETVAEKLSVHPTVVIAKVDAVANEIEGITSDGLPTLKFYPANNKVAVVFDGERTRDAIIEFVKAHSS